ncbi:MAG TPA: hypothetical protein VNX70_15220 [Bryobacteraceae bacterium]|nr:hypothetical protein [Bryobacteraceae bacterium]
MVIIPWSYLGLRDRNTTHGQERRCFEEEGLKAAVMDQSWVIDFYEFEQELPPDAALV